jgi:hypothetical protein
VIIRVDGLFNLPLSGRVFLPFQMIKARRGHVAANHGLLLSTKMVHEIRVAFNRKLLFNLIPANPMMVFSTSLDFILMINLLPGAELGWD